MGHFDVGHACKRVPRAIMRRLQYVNVFEPRRAPDAPRGNFEFAAPRGQRRDNYGFNKTRFDKNL